jgi:hypothetical protein
MTSPTFLRYAGWAAFSSAVAIVLMVATAILGATLRLGNTFSVVVVFLMALLIVVALALYLILRSASPAMNLAATAIGILGMLLTGAVHVLAMASALPLDQFNTTGEGIGPAGIGLWLLLANSLALQSKALPRGLTWIGLIAGAGWLLSAVGALIGGIANAAVLTWPSGNLPRLPDLGDLVGTQAAGKVRRRTSNGAVWLGKSRSVACPGAHQSARLADRVDLDGADGPERRRVHLRATGSCAPLDISGTV